MVGVVVAQKTVFADVKRTTAIVLVDVGRKKTWT
jgi:hypothetical protein